MKIIYVEIDSPEEYENSNVRKSYRFTLDDVYFENKSVLRHELNKLFSNGVYAYNEESLELNKDFNGGRFYTGFEGDWDIIDYDFLVLDEQETQIDRDTMKKLVEKAVRKNTSTYALHNIIEEEHDHYLTKAEHALLLEILDSLEITVHIN